MKFTPPFVNIDISTYHHNVVLCAKCIHFDFRKSVRGALATVPTKVHLKVKIRDNQNTSSQNRKTALFNAEVNVINHRDLIVNYREPRKITIFSQFMRF